MASEHPRRGEEAALRELWALAFGDGEAEIGLYFSTVYAPERCLLLRQEGRLAAALHWMDVSCRGVRMAYIYAVATHPACRGRGLCRELMDRTQDHLARQGYAAALLMPADPGLRRMYAAMGYRDCTQVAERACAAGAALPVRRIEITEYAARRRQLLPEGGVVQEGAALAYLAGFAGLYAGDGFVLAAVKDGDTLRGLELLGDPAAAPGITAALGCAQGTFRTPGQGRSFAMMRPLTEQVQPPTYFGLVFD